MHLESGSSPTSRVSQLDSESGSVCGSGDTYGDLGNAGDPMSELWWQEDEDSNLAASEEGNQIDFRVGELDPADQDPNEGFFRLPDTLTDLRKQLLGEYVLPTEPPLCLSKWGNIPRTIYIVPRNIFYVAKTFPFTHNSILWSPQCY